MQLPRREKRFPLQLLTVMDLYMVNLNLNEQNFIINGKVAGFKSWEKTKLLFVIVFVIAFH